MLLPSEEDSGRCRSNIWGRKACSLTKYNRRTSTDFEGAVPIAETMTVGNRGKRGLVYIPWSKQELEQNGKSINTPNAQISSEFLASLRRLPWGNVCIIAPRPIVGVFQKVLERFSKS